MLSKLSVPNRLYVNFGAHNTLSPYLAFLLLQEILSKGNNNLNDIQKHRKTLFSLLNDRDELSVLAYCLGDEQFHLTNSTFVVFSQ